MTREEVKDLLPILQAFAEGRVIQYRDNGVWKDITTEEGFYTDNAFVNVNDYRIKPEPTYRPFANAEECWKEMQKHQPFGWMKVQGQYRLIVRLVDGIFQIDKADSVTSFKEAMRYCKFADGTPFGIKEEEE